MVITLKVATRRIQKFLLLEEQSWSVITQPKVNEDQEHEMANMGSVLIRDGVFSWVYSTIDTTHNNKLDFATLQDINLTVFKGSLTAIVGRVGQGKSSLLSALIGEMYKHQGSVQVLGSVAFVSQQAWIQNGTIMNNILFGQPLNKERYEAVISAACLQHDLEVFSAGDQTEIGERGINLSGGQKQRISLARVAYQAADIYLLDDPLSAVDAHVSQHLWKNMIGPNGLLKSKTRLLATHNIHYLNEMDQIVIINGGRISASGTFDQLTSTGSLTTQELSLSFKSGPITGEQVHDTAKAINDTVSSVAAGSTNGIRGRDANVADEQGDQDKDGKIILKEEYTHGEAGWKEFLLYAKAAWTEQSFDDQLDTLGVFLGVYTAMVFAYAFSDVLVHYVVFVTSGLRAATLLHNSLLARITRLPMSFFDSTPFSTDQDTVDVHLPQALSDFYFYTFTVFGTLVVISLTLPIFTATIPFLFGFYILIQIYYVRTSRAMSHVHAIARSPLFQHFNETITGVSTIRAMRQEVRFIEENTLRIDKAANAYFVTTVSSRWLHFRLECLGATVVLATSLLVVLETVRRTAVSGLMLDGKAGLALNYALTATYGITFLVTTVTDLQNRLVSVERVCEYSNISTEAPLRIETVDKELKEQDWPNINGGGIVFKEYSTRYRQGMDLVLKKVSFEVKPGEKVGIVGRTGAGKSSLTLALFRIIEADNSHWARTSNPIDRNVQSTSIAGVDRLETFEVEQDGGSIWIGGVDISIMGLETLRQHLAIIPQDPVLFEGTLRENLDPFFRYSDSELWLALERAHLKDFITVTLSGDLSYKVEFGGSNFSIGQRSLICLARALLQQSEILVLDEATAAVDVETDELIQQTIREEFSDKTILIIAHRIKTVMDTDKILVLEKGMVEEFGAPQELLRNHNGLFYQLAKQAGEVK
ncbi:hypothetical protein FBU30_008060 [Linnemannia zychae]|nr:hypothetical protein FBU30_008060 [Linnemannia zychae]